MTDGEDEARERAIEAYDVLDRPPRPELTAIAHLAATSTGTPGASVDLGLGELRERVAAYGATDSEPVATEPLVTPGGITVGFLNLHGPPAPAAGRVSLLPTLAARVVDALELELATRRLAAADERLVTFAGQVSHDLKNPLAAIRMSVELVHEELGAEGEPEQLGLLARALRGADRMNRMIGDLQDFAGVDRTSERVEVDLGRLVEEIVEDIGEGVASPGQVRTVDLPTVRGDTGQLRTLLGHLIENALTFAPWDAPVEITGEELSPGWRVSVADHGAGVPLDQRERVFDPMVRLDSTVPGSGLGLAICRRVVQAHGGRIGIDDRPGGGSVAWFELPA